MGSTKRAPSFFGVHLFLPREESSKAIVSLERPAYIEHSGRDHNFDYHDCIAAVQDKRRRDQCHDNNHDRRNSRTDLGHATIDWEDIARRVCSHGRVEVSVKPRWECKMLDRSCHVASMGEHPLRPWKVLDLNSSPDLCASGRDRLNGGVEHACVTYNRIGLATRILCRSVTRRDSSCKPSAVEFLQRVNTLISIEINCSIGDQTTKRERDRMWSVDSMSTWRRTRKLVLLEEHRVNVTFLTVCTVGISFAVGGMSDVVVINRAAQVFEDRIRDDRRMRRSFASRRTITGGRRSRKMIIYAETNSVIRDGRGVGISPGG